MEEFISKRVEGTTKDLEEQHDGYSKDLRVALVKIHNLEAELTSQDVDKVVLVSDLEKARAEVSSLKKEVVKLEKEKWALAGNNRQLSQSVVKERAEASKAMEEASWANDEVSRIKNKMGSFLDRFLGSDAFRHAALISMKDMMKASMYNQLIDVAKYYPFTPEQFGFAAPVDEEAHAIDVWV